MQLLDELKLPEDIKRLNRAGLNRLSKEIRTFLINSVSKTGGHLASNLGIVELTLALFREFDFSKDSIVWDVGHQSYVYKMLTGRLNKFDSLRNLGGLCGFPSREESKFDFFGTGHASTSIAAANGIAEGKKIIGDDSSTIAVIGDGALTGGLALEGLNNIASSNNRLIIILNDNEMSIDENIGATNKFLTKLRISKKYNTVKGSISNSIEKVPYIGQELHDGVAKIKDVFKQAVIPEMGLENLGIKYFGPINGHDVNLISGMLREAKNFDRPVMIHIKTQKGRGYSHAIENPSKYHGISPFDLKTGKVTAEKKVSYTDIFEKAILGLARNDEKIVGISAAMVSSTGLGAMKSEFPERVFDVGIAEEYAVTFSAGLSCEGIKPVVAIYSTFLQRAYDQLLHDVCLQKLPVIFAVDRAGIVGKDGATHQGLFDIAFLNTLPNMNIIAPINAKELEEALKFALELNRPVAIRYPRGTASFELDDKYVPFEYGKGQIIRNGHDIAIIAAGTMVHTAMKVAESLDKEGISSIIVNPRFLKPFDKTLVDELIGKVKYIFTVEEGIKSGGFGQNIADYVRKISSVRVCNIGIDNEFIPHGDVSELLKKYNLDSISIQKTILKTLEKWRSVEEKTGRTCN